jgi:peptidoglycan-associated lipoprotein
MPLAIVIHINYICRNYICCNIAGGFSVYFNFTARRLRMKKMAIVLVPLLLIACSTTKPNAATSESSKPKSVSTSTTPQSESNARTGSVNNADTEALKLAERARLAREMADQLKKESVYFDFDKSDIKPEFRDVVQKQADFMSANGGDSVTLEGNCDERGSDEYNLALGERRADAVSRQMQVLGVAQGKIKTVSYGNEKPRLTCHEEKCWQENRRVDFVHQLN